jgi:hypothetical protein
MRMSALIVALILGAGPRACQRANSDTAAPTTSSIGARNPTVPASTEKVPAEVDFTSQVRPILELRCTPCHFEGGTMYQRLPFDRPETINELGTKLFSRIKVENEQRLIREFLKQYSKPLHPQAVSSPP